ncbi:HesA/MoeB/ThiF family protein [Natranaerofaba carboxydovora]|uniref:HesA/MoeB/ThiF family protein n=1 Tax=Natranaerofaba carboxydovora TaxID=2742683 RepID=UPI001F142D15|nr:HesA/MoeB/ThiF family protein [Natranaerofaba carboxydovora]UMZ72580.1 putative adenylyltransferase/sulfurtransferase MoeZ [Natranaerofaba carboxydovora]
MLENELRKNCVEEKLADNSPINLLSVTDEANISKKMNVSHKDIQKKALESKIFPTRYLRNYGTVGFDGQLTLLNSTVGVVGAGGLGGYIVEFLARMGIGNLVVIDDDTFEDNNLNRQLLSTEENLAEYKTSAVSPRVDMLNKGVDVKTITNRLTEDNGEELLGECDVIVDALDNLPSRYALEETAKSMGVPMVHGAIGGFIGQVMTIFPDDTGLSAIYPKKEDAPDKLIEVSLGNPTATPPMIASWQVQECVKILTGLGEPLRNCLLYFDALEGQVETIKII